MASARTKTILFALLGLLAAVSITYLVDRMTSPETLLPGTPRAAGSDLIQGGRMPSNSASLEQAPIVGTVGPDGKVTIDRVPKTSDPVNSAVVSGSGGSGANSPGRDD